MAHNDGTSGNALRLLKMCSTVVLRPSRMRLELFYKSLISSDVLKAGFHMIADDRGSQIAESSAIVCDHIKTHFCDRLRSCDRDRRRSQKIDPCSIFCDRLRSSAIICNRLRSCDRMETKVLRSKCIP